jgi:MFS family permease
MLFFFGAGIRHCKFAGRVDCYHSCILRALPPGTDSRIKSLNGLALADLVNLEMNVQFSQHKPKANSQRPTATSVRKQQTVFYIIVLAQFCGTSLWFAGNAVLPELQSRFGWPSSSLGSITSSTQLGFIAGTLIFAILGLVDRYSPSRVFLISSLIASAANLFALVDLSSVTVVYLSRFAVGFFLAGIYPVGMKIAADWNQEGLGHWLGALVGALVLGTAFPQALKIFPQFVDPQFLLLTISFLCVAGAVLLFMVVPDGPFRKKGTSFSFKALTQIFTSPSLRSPALGYFGHMWELYAFWAFVPWIVYQYFGDTHPPLLGFVVSYPIVSFAIIAAGALGCYVGGILSFRIGSFSVAKIALISSGVCCLISPFIWSLPFVLFFMVMIFWGFTVSADSPQFSALVARNAPLEYRGSIITLVVCIGFSITIGSIYMLNFFSAIVNKEILLVLLAPGPILGVMSMRK